MPTRIPVAPNMTSMPATSDRVRQICAGTSGRRADRSTAANAASKTNAKASNNTVRDDPQPCAGAPARPCPGWLESSQPG